MKETSAKQYEQQADVSRSRLLRIIDALDQRRRGVTSTLKRALGLSLALVVVAGAAGAIGSALAVRRLARRSRAGELAGRAVIALVGLLLGQEGRAALQRVFERQRLSTRTLH